MLLSLAKSQLILFQGDFILSLGFRPFILIFYADLVNLGLSLQRLKLKIKTIFKWSYNSMI